MKPIYILLRFLTTLLLCFAGSFLLDLQIINSNWLRYTLVVVLIITVFIIGSLWVYQDIKKLK